MNYGRTGKTKDTFLTPEWILDLVREFRPIGLDPATNLENSTGADIICVAPGTVIPPFDQSRGVILEDGLNQPWADLVWTTIGLVWCNPPFIHKALFLAKATEEYRNGAEILMIVPSDPTARWWQNWVSPRLAPGATAVCYLSKRPTFLDPDTGQPPLALNKKTGKMEPTSAMFGCAIVYFGNDIQKFRDIFGPHGDVDTGGR